MGAFVDRDDVLVVRDEGWEGWEQATIQRLDTADYDAIRAEVNRIGSEKQEDDSGKVTLLTKRQHTLAQIPAILRGVRSWTFTANGKKPSESNPPMEITRETVGALTRRYSQFLYDKVNDFNADWTQEERDRFFRAMREGIQGRGVVSG